jgi:hypothetical protein
MNDQIKDFVEKNREEFDHLEAPGFDMQRFKQVIAQPATPKAKTVSIFSKTKWLVAASVLIAIAATALLVFQEKETKVNYATTQPAHVDNRPMEKTSPTILPEKHIENKTPQVAVAFSAQPKAQKKHITNLTNVSTDYKALRDSSSASMRLLAILEIEKSGNRSNKVIKMLSETLNHDGNTNVRLAALSVLQKYSSDSYTSSLLVASLSKQDDPIVQLGLISMLGKVKNVKIDDQLYAIANNPDTFSAVRDEAYNVLLNQDKL